VSSKVIQTKHCGTIAGRPSHYLFSFTLYSINHFLPHLWFAVPSADSRVVMSKKFTCDNFAHFSLFFFRLWLIISSKQRNDFWRNRLIGRGRPFWQPKGKILNFTLNETLLDEFFGDSSRELSINA
jgi:hypothetical protein